MTAHVAPPALETPLDPKRWRILATMVAAQFIVVVDAFIVNVALPAIRADVGASGAETAAIVAAYQIAYASAVITGGRLGDLFGARRVFLIGLSAFVASSVWCGLAASGAELVFARLAQGLGGALMAPQALGTIHTRFPDPAERARAFGVFGVALGLGGAVGFVLGGLIVTADVAGLGWRLIFFVNAPVGAVVAVAALRLMPSGAPREAALDVGGALLLFAGLAAALGAAMAAPEASGAWPCALFAAGLAALVVFHVHERRLSKRGGHPLIDPALTDDSRFRRGALAAFLFFAANVSFYVVATLYLQNGRGASALAAGLVVLPLALCFTAASRLAASRALARGVGALIDGCLVQIAALAAAAALLLLADAPPLWAIAGALAVFGIGQGLTMAPLFSMVLAHVRPAHAGAGAGVMATIQQAGNASGVAAVGALFLVVANAASHRAAFVVAIGALALTLVAAIAAFSTLDATPRAGERAM